MKHYDIRKFTMGGTIAERNILQTKDRLVKSVEDSFRDEGYVPVIDLEPLFESHYQPEHGHYVFTLSVYGAYIGKEQSWQVSGVTSGKMIPTPQRKSKPASTPQE